MNDIVLKDLRAAEVRYSCAIKIGNTEMALKRNHQIYRGLWTLFQKLKDPEEKSEIAYELNSLAMQGRLIEEFHTQLNQSGGIV